MRKLRILIWLVVMLMGFCLTQTVSGQKNNDTLLYRVDVDQSLLKWRADNHWGTLKFKSGIVGVAEGELTKANFTMIMDSVRNSDIDYDLMRSVLENTIKSQELLHAGKFPFSFFDLCCTEKLASDSLMLKGDLTLKGIPACISFKSYVKWDDQIFEAQTDTISIDRTDWGIFAMSKNYGGGDESYIVSDTIYVQIELKANRVPEEHLLESNKNSLEK
jgi:hypothetical protein